MTAFNERCNQTRQSLHRQRCLFAGQLGKAPKVADDSLPVLEPAAAAAADPEADEDVTGMQARLEALRS